MQGIIDRFEGDYAVVEFEGKEMKNVPKNELPVEIKEGDVIVLINGKYQVNQEETLKRKMDIKKLTENMWE